MSRFRTDNHRRRRAPRGVMLVEILLALAITGMIAAGVASLLFATAGGTKERQDLRRRNVRVDVVAARVDAAVRSCGTALGRDANCLVLWVSDSKLNGMPDLSELRRIEWDPATKRLLCFEAPSTLLDADNTAYALATTDFVTTTAALRGTASFPSTVWGNGVSGWTSSPSPITQSTRLVSYEVTIDLTEGGTHTARSAVALRGTPRNGD
jgi:hypothetical protein